MFARHPTAGPQLLKRAIAALTALFLLGSATESAWADGHCAHHAALPGDFTAPPAYAPDAQTVANALTASAITGVDALTANAIAGVDALTANAIAGVDALTASAHTGASTHTGAATHRSAANGSVNSHAPAGAHETAHTVASAHDAAHDAADAHNAIGAEHKGEAHSCTCLSDCTVTTVAVLLPVASTSAVRLVYSNVVRHEPTPRIARSAILDLLPYAQAPPVL